MADADAPKGQLLAPIRHIARLTLEAVTPLSVASGEGSETLDAPLFRDWNNLPCLSAAGVAGVLRAAWREVHGEAGLKALFGDEAAGADDGQSSRLMVSFGLAQDSEGKALGGLADLSRRDDDPVLKLLLEPAPIKRQGVAINEDGGALEHALFERALVPVGTRFSLDLSLDGWRDAEAKAEDRELLKRVTALVESPQTRFGGAGRRGLGRLKIVEERSGLASLDRHGEDGRLRWLAFRLLKPHETPRTLNGRTLFEDLTLVPRGGSAIEATLTLRPKGFWRLGQGGVSWTGASQKQVRSPLAEAHIDWSKSERVVMQDASPKRASVPAAGIKGALVHRAEFHLRRMKPNEAASAGRMIDELFGSGADKGGGQAGRVFIDDIAVDATTTLRTRNSTDRHTHGGRDGKLFNDEALWKGEIVLSIVVRPEGVSQEALRALDWALQDLCGGRLAIGAGDAVGDGILEGKDEGKIVWRVGEETRESLVEAAKRIARPAGAAGAETEGEAAA